MAGASETKACTPGASETKAYTLGASETKACTPCKHRSHKAHLLGPRKVTYREHGKVLRMKEMGDWMKINSSAIYATRAIAPYKEGAVCYTRSPEGYINAICLSDGEDSGPPATITLPSFAPRPGTIVTMLRVDTPLEWEKNENGCVVYVPESVRSAPPCQHAWTVRIQPE